MANNTRKMLKELSDLTSNMDVLAKELKDSVKSNKEIAENVGNLTNNIERDKVKSNKPDEVDHNKPEEKLFDNLTKSFNKVIIENNENIKDMVSKTMESTISDFTKNLPTGITKAKIDSKFNKVFENDGIKDFINKAAESIPGLEDVGEIIESGAAIVGEAGPELVELKKDDKVRTMEEQLSEHEIIEIKKSKKVQNKTIEESWDKTLEEKDNLVTDEPILASKEKNIPSEDEINIEKERLIKDNPSLKEDPVQLNDDINYYIEEYDREAFTQEDVAKLNEPVNKDVVDKSEPTDGIVTEKKQKSGFLSKLAKKSKELFEGISVDMKNVKAEALSPEMSMLSSSYLDSVDVDKKKHEISNPTQAQELKSKDINDTDIKSGKLSTKANREDNKQKLKEKITSKSESELDKSPDVLKPSIKKKQPDNIDSVGEQETSKAKEASVNNSNEPNVPKEQRKLKKKNKTVDVVSPVTAKDLQDIKSLLVAINRSLSSPLSIASDQPYRPETNHF